MCIQGCINKEVLANNDCVYTAGDHYVYWGRKVVISMQHTTIISTWALKHLTSHGMTEHYMMDSKNMCYITNHPSLDPVQEQRTMSFTPKFLNDDNPLLHNMCNELNGAIDKADDKDNVIKHDVGKKAVAKL